MPTVPLPFGGLNNNMAKYKVLRRCIVEGVTYNAGETVDCKADTAKSLGKYLKAKSAPKAKEGEATAKKAITKADTKTK